MVKMLQKCRIELSKVQVSDPSGPDAAQRKRVAVIQLSTKIKYAKRKVL